MKGKGGIGAKGKGGIDVKSKGGMDDVNGNGDEGGIDLKKIAPKARVY